MSSMPDSRSRCSATIGRLADSRIRHVPSGQCHFARSAPPRRRSQLVRRIGHESALLIDGHVKAVDQTVKGPREVPNLTCGVDDRQAAGIGGRDCRRLRSPSAHNQPPPTVPLRAQRACPRQSRPPMAASSLCVGDRPPRHRAPEYLAVAHHILEARSRDGDCEY
jgi:hypothetical protein